MSWVTKKLGDLLKIQNGYAFDSKLFSLEGEMPLIRIRDIKKGVETETRYTGDYDIKYVVKKGDLLIGMDGEFGCYEWKGNNALLNQRVCRLQEFENQIYPRFLLYGINSYLKAIEEVTGYTTVKHISSKQIANIEFPLPSFQIQQKIVAKLDAIFAEIDKASVSTEDNAKNADALFQSYLTELFERGGDGWVEKKLQEITTKIGSGATPKGGGESYKETGISLIRSMNVYDDGFFYPKLAFIDDAQAKELANVTVEEHDVLLNITGASVARCCIVPSDILPARVNQHVSILRAKKNVIIPSLLHLLLISPLHKRRLLSVGEGGGTTRQAITKAQLQEYVIRFPISHVEQLKLIEKISEIHSFTEKIKSSFENKLKNLPILKQSILKQAFNGELVKE